MGEDSEMTEEEYKEGCYYPEDAVMQIKWQDHANRSLCPVGMSNTLCATWCRKAAAWEAVIRCCFPMAWSRHTMSGLLAGVASQHACWTMLRLACVGHIQCESILHR